MTIFTDYDPASTLTTPQDSTLETSSKLALVRRSLPNWVKAEMNWSQQLWWHTKAYGTILSVVLLACGSLVVLFLHRQLRQLFR